MNKKQIIETLKDFPYDKEQYWLITGGAMVLYGLREETSDIDLGCTKELADKLETEGYLCHRTEDGKRCFKIGEDIEVLEDWLYDEVGIYEDVPVISVKGLLEMKKKLGREKDLKDIELIENHFKMNDERPEIRLMDIDDYDEVYDLWLSASGVGLNDLDDSKEGIRKFLDRNPKTCFVAVKEERIAGVIMAGNDGRRGYIYHLAVAEGYRRQGMATELVNKVMTSFKELGINKAALVVLNDKEAANSFWEKTGFEKREDICYRNKLINEMVRYDIGENK